jgi:hypothetical protein
LVWVGNGNNVDSCVGEMVDDRVLDRVAVLEFVDDDLVEP